MFFLLMYLTPQPHEARRTKRVARSTSHEARRTKHVYSACAPDTTSMISRVIAAWRTLFM
jgi:hypothetical protein